MELAAVGIVCLLVGVGLAYGVLSNISNSKIKTAEQQLKDAQTNADRIASEAARQAETVKKEAVLEAKEEVLQLKQAAEADEKKRKSELRSMEIVFFSVKSLLITVLMH